MNTKETKVSYKLEGKKKSKIFFINEELDRPKWRPGFYASRWEQTPKSDFLKLTDALEVIGIPYTVNVKYIDKPKSVKKINTGKDEMSLAEEIASVKIKHKLKEKKEG